MNDRSVDFWASITELQRNSELREQLRFAPKEDTMSTQRKVVILDRNSGPSWMTDQSSRNSDDARRGVYSRSMNADVQPIDFARNSFTTLDQVKRFEGLLQQNMPRKLISSATSTGQDMSTIGDRNHPQFEDLRIVTDGRSSLPSASYARNQEVNYAQLPFLDRDGAQGLSRPQDAGGTDPRIVEELTNLFASNTEIRKAILDVYRTRETAVNVEREPTSTSENVDFEYLQRVENMKRYSGLRNSLYERREPESMRIDRSEERSGSSVVDRSFHGSERRSKSPKEEIKRSKSPKLELRRSRSPKRENRRSKSPLKELMRSRSPKRESRRSKSPIRELKKSKSSPVRDGKRSKSPKRDARRSKSPKRDARRSKSPKREARRSKSPRRRSKSPKRVRKRSASPRRRGRRSRTRSRSRSSSLSRDRRRTNKIKFTIGAKRQRLQDNEKGSKKEEKDRNELKKTAEALKKNVEAKVSKSADGPAPGWVNSEVVVPANVVPASIPGNFRAMPNLPWRGPGPVAPQLYPPVSWSGAWPRPGPFLDISMAWQCQPAPPGVPNIPLPHFTPDFRQYEAKPVQRHTPTVLVNVPLTEKSNAKKLPPKDAMPPSELPKLMMLALEKGKSSVPSSTVNKDEKQNGRKSTKSSEVEKRESPVKQPAPPAAVPKKKPTGKGRIQLNLLDKREEEKVRAPRQQPLPKLWKQHRKNIRHKLLKKFTLSSCMYCGMKHLRSLEALTDALAKEDVEIFSGSKVSHPQNVDTVDKDQGIEIITPPKKRVEVVNISDDELAEDVSDEAIGDEEMTEQAVKKNLESILIDCNIPDVPGEKLEEISDEENADDFQYCGSDGEFVVLEEFNDSEGVEIEEISSNDDNCEQLDVDPQVEEPEDSSTEGKTLESGPVPIPTQKVNSEKAAEEEKENESVPIVDNHDDDHPVLLITNTFILSDGVADPEEDQTPEASSNFDQEKDPVPKSSDEEEEAVEMKPDETKVEAQIEEVEGSDEGVKGDAETENKSVLGVVEHLEGQQVVPEVPESIFEDSDRPQLEITGVTGSVIQIEENSEDGHETEVENDVIIDELDNDAASTPPAVTANSDGAEIVVLDKEESTGEDENSNDAVEDVYISDGAMEEFEERNPNIVDLVEHFEDIASAKSCAALIGEILESEETEGGNSVNADDVNVGKEEDEDVIEVSPNVETGDKTTPESEREIVDTKTSTTVIDLDIYELKDGGAELKNDLFTINSSGESSQSSDAVVAPEVNVTAVTLTSDLAVDHFAAGSIDVAFALLRAQLGIVDFDVYKSVSMVERCTSSTLRMAPEVSLMVPNKSSNLPFICPTMGDMLKRLQLCYQATTSGNVENAIVQFRDLLRDIPLMRVEKRRDVSKARMLINICRNYVLSLVLESKKKSLDKNSLESEKRACELAAYETHCNLQSVHQVLTLRIANSMFFKIGNFKTAASFSRKILEANPSAEVADKTRKLLAICEKNNVNTVNLVYDPDKQFSICAETLTPIYVDEPEIKCPMCMASYMEAHKGILCRICCLAEVGRQATGLKLRIEGSS